VNQSRKTQFFRANKDSMKGFIYPAAISVREKKRRAAPANLVMDLARRKTKMRNLIFSPQSTPFVWYFPVALLFAKISEQ